MNARVEWSGAGCSSVSSACRLPAPGSEAVPLHASLEKPYALGLTQQSLSEALPGKGGGGCALLGP